MYNPLGMTDLQRQEFHGLYWEKIEQIVDGVEGEILDGNITSKDEARQWTDEAVVEAEWVSKDCNEWYCIYTLLFSQHACAGFDYEQAPSFLRSLFESGHDGRGVPRGGGYRSGDSFPFYEFALSAMLADAREKLEARQAYKELR